MYDKFDNLQKGFMTIIENAHFYTLPRYSVANISIKSEQIQKFIKGLDATYQLSTTQMVISGVSIQSITEHAKMTELIIQVTQEGTKKVHCHGKFSRHAS